MTAFTSETVIGDVVTADPSRARTLERFGIDYCCNGQRSIAAACASAGVNADELLSALADGKSGPQADWANFDDTTLIDHILDTHHRFLWDEFPRMSALVDKVARVHGPNHSELTRVRDAFEQLRGAIEQHLHNEETALFPALTEQAGQHPISEELRAALDENMREHDRAGSVLAELRQLTGGYAIPADACASYTAMLSGLEGIEADLHMHVHKENNVLFSRVLASAER